MRVSEKRIASFIGPGCRTVSLVKLPSGATHPNPWTTAQ